MRYERMSQAVAPRATYLARLRRSATVGSLLILVSLLAGAAGYHGFEHLSWIDAFLNAAMILGGMGPVATLATTGGKIFATVYALYSGFVLLIAVGIVIAPTIHRLLHRFHVQE